MVTSSPKQPKTKLLKWNETNIREHFDYKAQTCLMFFLGIYWFLKYNLWNNSLERKGSEVAEVECWLMFKFHQSQKLQKIYKKVCKNQNLASVTSKMTWEDEACLDHEWKMAMKLHIFVRLFFGRNVCFKIFFQIFLTFAHW